MAHTAIAPNALSAAPKPGHSALVRVTHWIATFCFFALLLSGVELVISHPRFYWGEAGTVMTPALFQLPIPASRPFVKTGYGYVLPDQNGWSRSLHFQAAWAVVFTGLLYLLHAARSGHLRRNLLPARADLSWRAFTVTLADHLRFTAKESGGYNLLQRLAYLKVIFVVFPLIILSGLAMSPAVTAVVPAVVVMFGGQQSARTIHFFLAIALVLFLLIHIAMICITGFRRQMRAMTLGEPANTEEIS